MRVTTLLVALLLSTLAGVDSFAQEMPLVYEVENTGADCPEPPLPSYRDLPAIDALPDPFAWSDTAEGRISSRSDWRCRRAQVSTEIQHYEMGYKPVPTSEPVVSFSDGVLTITIEENEASLTLNAPVNLPDGEGPFPAVIGVGFGGTGSLPADIFTDRDVATIQYDVNEVATYGNGVGRVGPFYDLYPNGTIPSDSRGKFVAWAWGISRIVDALEQVPELGIDRSHIAVTGCSFAGKISLFSGALDERIALTIAQEPGGGGATAWRVTETLDGSRETLNNTNGNWYRSTFIPLFGNAVETLPYDHHELMAMVAPRALLVLGNPDYEWLAEESGYVSSMAAQEVWTALDVPDRFGFSIVGGHNHCQLPASQRPEVIAYVEKFLLGDESADTDVAISPYTTDLTPWITWETPELSSGTTAIDEGASADRTGLLQNYPNPFRGTTTISYVLQRPAHVELSVYNAIGQRVKTLVEGFNPTGEHAVTWHGDDESGRAMPSGVYFYRIRVGDFESASTMVLFR